uniref:Uncharacterized protein n=1 Tax=Eutreptiella gymnastica TaxID=73025 RepID=A0A7S1I9N7_9EUGL|mmetsp:Transcript_140967/g.245699  ORF Transcript_140967/g.245699 Transcript_140967/m.245699 type:complete len:133 (+) Transcript_140967:124-522(+)
MTAVVRGTGWGGSGPTNAATPQLTPQRIPNTGRPACHGCQQRNWVGCLEKSLIIHPLLEQFLTSPGVLFPSGSPRVDQIFFNSFSTMRKSTKMDNFIHMGTASFGSLTVGRVELLVDPSLRRQQVISQQGYV